VVYRKSSDPRFGDFVTRLTNIQLGAPDPTLFEPPADYTIIDDKEPVKLTLPRPSAAPERPSPVQ
jgi:hypothetical protein